MTDEERYNNRQVEKMFDDQSRDIKSHVDMKIEPLTAQVTKTNGTVAWQTKLLYTGLGALMLLVPWAGWVTTQILENEDSLTRDDVIQIIDDSLEDY